MKNCAAIVLCAGQGRRMGSLTESTPKPLVLAGDHTFLQWQIANIRAAGIGDIFINCHTHGDQLMDAIKAWGDPELFCTKETLLLGTAGGVANLIDVFHLKDRYQRLLICNSDAFLAFADLESDPILNEAPCTMICKPADQVANNRRYNRVSFQGNRLVGIHPSEGELIYSGYMMATPTSFDIVPRGHATEMWRDYWSHMDVSAMTTSAPWIDLGEKDLFSQNLDLFLRTFGKISPSAR